jgi:thiol-disulfide isomerase/thioredoxin
MKWVIVVFALLLAAHPALAGEPRPFVQGSWQELRQLHHGRPTIVHFWGLTCAPCMVEMPRWAELAKADRTIDLVLVDADPVGEDPNADAPMLAKMGLSGTESWRFADAFSERLRFEIDPKWHGELPLTLLVGRDGTVRKIVGSADFAEVRQWLTTQREG